MKPLILNVQGFPQEFDFHNGQFPPLDALTYWHYLKKAKRVIEVGCGYSTFLASKAGVEITASYGARIGQKAESIPDY